MHAEQAHHPLAVTVTDGAIGVVVIHPDWRMIDELSGLRRTERTRVAVFGAMGLTSQLGDWAFDHDPTSQLLEGFMDRDQVAEPTPYGVVMEMLIDEWLRAADLWLDPD
jgi:hypothetical protein